MTEKSSPSRAYDSPLRLLIIIAASVFFTEACVMILLFILPPMPHYVAAPLDALLVTLIIYPVLYRYVVRPMNRHIAERQQVETALRRAQDELELRVNERTAELAQANESLQVQIVERQRASEDLKVALNQVQQRQAEMAGLLTGARAVLEYRDFAQMAQAIFEACRSTIGATAGYVALPTADQLHEKPVFSNLGEGASTPDVSLPMPIVGLRQQAYVTGKTAYTNDPGYCEFARLLPGGHLPLDNVLFAPMKIKGFVVGALGLANKSNGFSDDDARLATAFAELAAIAVLNSQTIELLESSERRFRTLAQATFEGIAISEEGIIREANEQYARMHGYTLPEVIGKPASDFLAPQDHERMRHAIAGDERHVGEYHALRKDGSMFSLEVRAYSTEQSGRAVWVAALRDITERKQAEEAIRARNALLSSIIESPDSAIFSINREYCYTSFNRRHAYVMKSLFGVDIEIGWNLLDYHTVASDRQSAKQNLDRALSGESFVIEDWAGDDALTRRCFEISHSPVKDADQIIGAAVFAQDITERKYADQMLRENEEWLRLAFEAGDLGRWRFSVATGMLHFDDRARVHAGLNHNFVSQAETLTRVFPDDRALLQQEVTDALNPAGHGRYAAEYRVVWPDGKLHWLAVQARVHFEGEGAARQPVLAVGISQDITARKQTEDRVTWLATFPELNPSPVVEVDLDGHTHYLNPAAKRLLPDLETAGQSHPWLADLEVLSQRFQADYTTVLNREIVFGDAFYQQTLFCVPNSQRMRIYSLDITARKRAEEQLRLLSTALEATVNGVAVTDRRGQILWVNPAFTGLTGYSRKEAVGQNPRILKSGQHHAEFYQEMWEKIMRGHPWSGEIINRRKDGTLYFEEMTITPVRVSGDEITHFVAIKEDITARKQAEEALRRQAALIELSPDAIIVRSLEGIITFWSLGAATLYGWKEHEALGTPISALLKPQLPEPLVQIVEQLKQTGRWAGEIVYHTRGGLRVIVQSWWLAQFNAQGGITEIFESNVDVTVRKQMEEQLRRNQLLLERRVLERTAELAAANNALRLQSAALQAAANGIIITDRQGNIQWANPALTEMTGYAAEEVLGQSTRLFRSGLKEPEFYQHLWNTILSGHVWRGELINRRKDGSLYVEEQTIAPVLNEHGKIANFVAVKQDVTARQEAQSRLEQNNRDLLALSKAEHDQRQLAETLAEANLTLTRSLDLETVLETLLDCVERLVPYDSANVMLLEAESRLAVRIARGYERWSSDEQVRAIAFDVQANPIINELVTTRRSRSVSDTSVQPGWESPPGVEHVRSWLGVPLVAGGNVIGLYSLDKTEPGYFTLDHVRKAEMLAGQAAVAVQNAWLFEQVRAGRERLQTLSRRLVESQEAERQYIARELHDEAGQALTSLLFGLGQIEQQIDSSGQAARIAELRQTTNDIIESLHRLAMDLRPASLDHLGLVPALLQQVRAIGDRHGLIARFKAIGLEDERLPAEVETAFYRMVQEALTNIVRHARATRVDVLLERRGDRIVVVVEDNGHGFDAEITRFMQEGHLGLAGIQERAMTLGGSLIIESTVGIGTTLVVEVPYGNSYSDC